MNVVPHCASLLGCCSRSLAFDGLSAKAVCARFIMDGDSGETRKYGNISCSKNNRVEIKNGSETNGFAIETNGMCSGT